MRRGRNLTANQQEALEIAASETERTVQLLHDLSVLARADSGRLQVELETIQLNAFLSEVAGMARQYADREIELDWAPHPIAVWADASHLKQIALNLIDNAVKYADGPITLQTRQQGDQAILKVCDRGPGIPLAQQARIFERFYRVDDDRARSKGGTGLGLALVKTLAAGMGGSVSVSARPGEGSTFTLNLPVQAAAAEPSVLQLSDAPGQSEVG